MTSATCRCDACRIADADLPRYGGFLATQLAASRPILPDLRRHGH